MALGLEKRMRKTGVITSIGSIQAGKPSRRGLMASSRQQRAILQAPTAILMRSLLKFNMMGKNPVPKRPLFKGARTV